MKADKALTEVSIEYADYIDVFSSKLVIELPKHTNINNHTIEWVDDQQSPYGSIYNLSPIKLEKLKAYIEKNLANDFITRTPIFFDQKLDKILRFYIDYQGFNNLIIKNRYLKFEILSSLISTISIIGWGCKKTMNGKHFLELIMTILSIK